MGSIAHNKHVTFRDPRLNRSREIRPEAVRDGIFDCFLNFDNCQPEIASDVISGMAIHYVGVDVRVKLGDSRLKPSEASFSAIFRTTITFDRK